ncbi:hypothetical protein ABN233_19885 [Proteus terrae]
MVYPRLVSIGDAVSGYQPRTVLSALLASSAITSPYLLVIYLS